MTPGLAIYLGGAAVVFFWLVRATPGWWMSPTLVNFAIWPALGWPIFALGFAVNFILKGLIPDRTDRGTKR